MSHQLSDRPGVKYGETAERSCGIGQSQTTREAMTQGVRKGAGGALIVKLAA